MTQPLLTSSDDYREREPGARASFEKLPEPMQRRLFELMAAMSGALYLPENQEKAVNQPPRVPAAAKPRAYVPEPPELKNGMSEGANRIAALRRQIADAFEDAPSNGLNLEDYRIARQIRGGAEEDAA